MTYLIYVILGINLVDYLCAVESVECSFLCDFIFGPIKVCVSNETGGERVTNQWARVLGEHRRHIQIKMAGKQTITMGKRRRPLDLELPSPSKSFHENAFYGNCPFSPDTMRRQRFLSESPSKETNDKHDVFHTLQETLEVLRDEAETSRDSNKRDDLWCHPFEIPDHPIQQQQWKNAEIARERKQSRMMLLESSITDNVVDLERQSSVSDVPFPLECDVPYYQRLSISGANISGVGSAHFPDVPLEWFCSCVVHNINYAQHGNIAVALKEQSQLFLCFCLHLRSIPTVSSLKPYINLKSEQN